MASIISHPAVPLAIGFGLSSRVISLRLLFAGVLCSMMPDLDVYAHGALGHYEGLEHRGLTHSIVFAGLCGAIAALFARTLMTTPRTAFLFIGAATASHGLLDALTNGGPGILFFWPFSDERYFIPLPVIEVSPLGIRNFFTARALDVLASELKWLWLPAILLGLVLRGAVHFRHRRN